jgi:RNA polymerase sigma-70 factor (ECF subfamily)
LRHLFAKFETEFDPKTLSAFRQLALLERPAPDVAAELGMTLGAIYVAKSRVLRRLREEAGELLDRGELPSSEG